MTRRFAIYAAPGTGSADAAGALLREQAERWLGRSVAGEPVPSCVPPGWTRAAVDAITASARRYGFHATIKAPFRLAAGRTAEELDAALARFAAGRADVLVPRLTLARLGGFFALVPGAQAVGLQALADEVVTGFDGFRARPTEAEIARRDPASLTARQRELLGAWGYPYVLDEFRFHLTLTDRIAPERRSAVERALTGWFAPSLGAAVPVDSLALFTESEPGAPFTLRAVHPLRPAHPARPAASGAAGSRDRKRRSAMTRETVLRNARIVARAEIPNGSVLIRDGLIADISSGPGTAGEDLGGDYLLPGVVELHTDHLEYHFSPRPGVQWDPLSAVLASDAQLAAAGATTVLDAMRIGSAPGHSDAATESARHLADSIELAADAGLLRADHAIHVRCEVSSQDCLDAFGGFADDPHVALVSLMDHTPGQRQYADIEVFKRYQIGQGHVTEADFDAFVAPLIERSARYADGHRRAIAGLAARRGITLATHDDATEEHVAESVALGVRICEFPTTVLAASAADEQGQRIVMGAPNLVRGGSQSGNVAAAELLGLGLLHILSSDYVPASPLQAVFQLAADDAVGLADGARLISGNPARAVGLDDRGEIAVGQRADLVRVQPHDLPATRHHPRGRRVPVVRGVYRQGDRVS